MTRVNLQRNPSFRAGLTNYAPLNGATLSLTTDYAFYGDTAMVVTKTADNNSGVTTTDPIAVLAGKPYAASVYVRLPQVLPAEDSANLVLSIEWINSAGTIVSTDQSVVFELEDDSTWVRLAGVWTAPVGATFAYISVAQLVGGNAGERFLVDAFLFEQTNYVGGYLDNLSQAEENKIVNKALSAPVPQVLNGLELNADVLLNDLVLNTIDESGTVWICTGIDGWYGQSAPELPNIARGTEDGSYDVSGRYAARVITVRGVFFPPSQEALGAARDRLVTAVNLVRKGGWLRTNEEPTKAAYIRLSGQPQIETVNARGRTEFSIGFRAGDPIKYHWNDADPEGYSHNSVTENREEISINAVSNPSMEAASALSYSIATNLSTNPRAEGAAGYTSNNGTLHSRVQVTSVPVVHPLGLTNAYRSNIIDGQVATSALSMYNIDTLGNTGPARGVGVWVLSMSPGFEVAAYSGFTKTPLTAGVWTFVTTPALVAANAFSGLQVSKTDGSNAVVGNVVYVTGAIALAGHLVTEYFDGSTPAAGDFAYTWSGTAGSSTSSQIALTVPGYGGIAGYSMPILSTEWAAKGTKSLRIEPLGTTTDTFVDLPIGLLTRGKTYTLLATVRLPSPQTGALSPSARTFYINDGTIKRSAAVPNVAGVAQIRYTVTIDGPPVIFRFINGSSSQPIWIDNFAVIEVPSKDEPYTGDYFDGSTPDADGTIYRWSGIDNASQSIKVPSNAVVGTVVNIGTADVTGLFTLTGPLGAGSTIYNAATDETASTIKPLRGKGVVGTITTASISDNVATIKTSANHHLIEGDLILVTGAGLPFDTVGSPAVVLGASNVFPYTINYAVISDDSGENPAVGQVQLAKNDELTIDTYNRVVTFNGTSVGQRSKLETLTDWIKFAPGVNTLEFFDKVDKLTVISKSIAGGVAMLTTSDVHYLIPGEPITISLGEKVALLKKSLTNNVVTLTTVVPHGFSIGDKIAVASTELSTIDQKSGTTTLATLRTVDANGVSVTDTILVNLPASATPVNKELTSNIAKITTAQAHGFSAGDTVVVALPTTQAVNQKALTANQATISTAVAHNYQIGDSITVALNTNASITLKAKSGTSAVMTTSTAHGFSSGDIVTMALPASAVLSNLREIKGSVVTRINRLFNPSGRRTTTGYSVTGGTLGQDIGQDAYVYSTTAGAAGSKSLRIGQLEVGTNLLPNTVYTLSASLLVQGQAVQPILYAEGAGVVTAAVSKAAVNSVSNWERVSFNFTTSATGTVFITIYNNGTVTAATHIMAFQDALLEEGPTLGSYFDGSTASTNALANSWLGTVDNSVSQQSDFVSPYKVTLFTDTPHGFSVGDTIQVNVGLAATTAITNRVSTATLATLTFASHAYSVGEKITVSGVSNARYNGTYTITAVTATTVSYALPSGTAEAAVASGGSVLNTSISSGYNGTKVISSVPTPTSLTYFYYGQDATTVSQIAATNPVLTNTTNVAFNGTKTLTSASGTQFTYNL
jgi:hypothetical protein